MPPPAPPPRGAVGLPQVLLIAVLSAVCVQAFIVHTTQPVGCVRALEARPRWPNMGACGRGMRAARAAIRPPKDGKSHGAWACGVCMPAANGRDPSCRKYGIGGGCLEHLRFWGLRRSDPRACACMHWLQSHSSYVRSDIALFAYANEKGRDAEARGPPI